jgi:hypothetical protein
MELSVWTSTTVDCTKWDERDQRWHVTLNRIVDGVSQIREYATQDSVPFV